MEVQVSFVGSVEDHLCFLVKLSSPPDSYTSLNTNDLARLSISIPGSVSTLAKRVCMGDHILYDGRRRPVP